MCWRSRHPASALPPRLLPALVHRRPMALRTAALRTAAALLAAMMLDCGLATGLLARFALPPAVAEERPPADPPASSASQPALAQPSIEEIARIRQSLGAALPTVGTLGDQAFVDALRRIAQRPAEPLPSATAATPAADNTPASAATTASSAITAGAASSATPAAPATINPPEPVAFPDPVALPDPVVPPDPVAPTRMAISTLRNAARDLDLQAYELDEHRKRAEARRLRRLAQALRQEADRLEDATVPPDTATSTATSATP